MTNQNEHQTELRFETPKESTLVDARPRSSKYSQIIQGVKELYSSNEETPQESLSPSKETPQGKRSDKYPSIVQSLKQLLYESDSQSEETERDEDEVAEDSDETAKTAHFPDEAYGKFSESFDLSNSEEESIIETSVHTQLNLDVVLSTL